MKARKKKKRKNKNYKYMVGIVSYHGDGHIPKTKNVTKTKKYMNIFDARKKGVNIYFKESPDPNKDDFVMVFKKEKGKYKPHSYYYKHKGKKYWDKVSTKEDLRQGTG